MACWNQDVAIESPPGRPEHSNIISPGEEYEVSHRLQTLETKIGHILKKAYQQKELPLQEDERAPYPVKDDSDSRTEILNLLQSMETKLNCIETCLEKDKGRLLTSIPEQNERISDRFLYTVLGNITDVDWKHLMRILGLTDPEMEGIKQGHLSDVKEQKYQMLQLIKQKKREKGATVTKGEIQQALNILKLTDVLSCTEAGSHVSAPAILG
ncbi:hypothetical protein AOXY_G201 [Acipenser oxyrinchus oxyrinchus]|uniref:Death domain-containing protein n=1 Tax=Acipenser oxyrinchus oxyrinchus TaxID=40147 RepID=A0AAD8GJW8_ACIOX|nr:hypothetical protein AOXY_G201 [Acipenser oxyrinchus oxyrinchus]